MTKNTNLALVSIDAVMAAMAAIDPDMLQAPVPGQDPRQPDDQVVEYADESVRRLCLVLHKKTQEGEQIFREVVALGNEIEGLMNDCQNGNDPVEMVKQLVAFAQGGGIEKLEEQKKLKDSLDAHAESIRFLSSLLDAELESRFPGKSEKIDLRDDWSLVHANEDKEPKHAFSSLFGGRGRGAGSFGGDPHDILNFLRGMESRRSYGRRH